MFPDDFRPFQEENTDMVRGSSLKIFRLFRYREYRLGKRIFPGDFQALPVKRKQTK
jgi:hypothetical protein